MTGGIVLAAGQSERFGSRKLLEPLDGLPLVCHSVLGCLSATEQTWIVVEQDDTRLGEAIASHFAGEQRLFDLRRSARTGTCGLQSELKRPEFGFHSRNCRKSGECR